MLSVVRLFHVSVVKVLIIRSYSQVLWSDTPVLRPDTSVLRSYGCVLRSYGRVLRSYGRVLRSYSRFLLSYLFSETFSYVLLFTCLFGFGLLNFFFSVQFCRHKVRKVRFVSANKFSFRQGLFVA